jgi:aspartate-semialdehyde dehydrogenase
VLDVRFVVLVHNPVRGAAGAAILNAELLVARGLIGGRRSARRPPPEPL